MLKQTEGSHAVAEADGAVPAAGDLRLPDHAADAHRRRPGRDGEVRRAHELRVHQRRIRVRRAVGGDRRVGRRRAHLHGDAAARACCSWPRRSTTPSGLGLPIVMTIGNRAIGAPINIWNDHSDSMSMRDAGWIQLFAETNQEALDLHIQAFRLAEELSCPVMVCMDGFILTHAYDRVDVPDAGAGRRVPAAVRAAADPRSRRAREHRRDGRARGVHRGALPRAPQAAARAGADPAARRGEFEAQFGRDSGGLIRTYRTDDAETIVVALGSVNGTVQEVVDEMRARGRARSARCRSARSGRSRSRCCARRCATRKRVVVLEKCLAVGLGGIVSDGVRKSLSGIQLNGYTVIAGLGGRAITRASLRAAVRGRASATSSSR